LSTLSSSSSALSPLGLAKLPSSSLVGTTVVLRWGTRGLHPCLLAASHAVSAISASMDWWRRVVVFLQWPLPSAGANCDKDSSEIEILKD
jgi:hypothetical protein